MKFTKIEAGKYQTEHKGYTAIVENTEERSFYGRVIWDITIKDNEGNIKLITATDENGNDTDTMKAAKAEAIRILSEQL